MVIVVDARYGGHAAGVSAGTASLLKRRESIMVNAGRTERIRRIHSCSLRLTSATVAFGVEAYEDVWTKAAALLQSVGLNHALIDGNKRLAWVAARVFLDLNDVPPAVVDVDQAETFVIQVVTHELDTVDEVGKGLIALYAEGPSR